MLNRDVVIGVIGIDHRHIYGMLEGMLATGARAKGWWTDGDPAPLAGFVKRFPDLPRVTARQALLDDPEINLILIAAPPQTRAALAIAAMEHGKDVMLDKPGVISAQELEQVTAVVQATGRIWSVDFSERYEVPSVLKALELVQGGAIGTLVQTLAMGPHRLNRQTRPDWFFDRALYGGILGDIGTHQIDQFLTFAGADDAQIISASAANYANPGDPDFQDFGEMLLQAGDVRGYARMDWYTPDALPNWGDGRLTLLGTQGYIELRKYVDVAGRAGTDHLFWVSNSAVTHIDCSDVPLTYFRDLGQDVLTRGTAAGTFQHTHTVTRLALQAQAMADAKGVK